MKIKAKKGISHIEVVLSFVIFISFLVFLLTILNPLVFLKEKKSSLANLEKEIEKQTSTEVKFLSISLENNEGCFLFEHSLSNITVKDEEGNKTDALSRNNEK